MKRILILLALLAISVNAYSQVEIKYKDIATLEWEELTGDFNDVPLAPTDVISYDVYLYDSALEIDDQITDNLTFMGNASLPSMELDFTGFDRAYYWAGVRYVVTRESGEIVVSPIAWSYDEVATDNVPFGYIRLTGVLLLPVPTHFRDSEI